MNKLIIAGIIIIFIIAGIFVTKSFTGNMIKDSERREFTINASRFVYEPDTITVNKGDKVRINIENTDTLHGIRIPEFNVKDNKRVEFIADKAGEFTWYCTNMCGAGHMQMQGKLIVK